MPVPPRLDLALAPSFLVPCSFEAEIFAPARTKLQSTLTYSQGFGRSRGEKDRFKTVYFIVSAGLGELFEFEILLSEAASLYVAQDGLNRALNAELGAVDAQIVVLCVAPGLVAVLLIEAGTILINFLDLLACLSLIKTLTLLKAFDARVGVAEDKYADNIVSVVEDIVGAATDEDAVFLGCDLADRVELCGNYLHVQTEILIQAIAACVQQES